jgi:hypothetical protein
MEHKSLYRFGSPKNKTLCHVWWFVLLCAEIICAREDALGALYSMVSRVTRSMGPFARSGGPTVRSTGLLLVGGHPWGTLTPQMCHQF